MLLKTYTQARRACQDRTNLTESEVNASLTFHDGHGYALEEDQENVASRGRKKKKKKEGVIGF